MQIHYRYAAAMALLAVFVTSCHAEEGQMAKSIQNCPATPNCVSSHPGADDDRHVLPFRIRGPVEAAWDTLKKVLKSRERTVIVEEDGAYLRAEETSRIFRFVDDVEFHLDPEQRLIHVRSASRVGYWDLGVNRNRIESLRERLRNLGVIE